MSCWLLLRDYLLEEGLGYKGKTFFLIFPCDVNSAMKINSSLYFVCLQELFQE
jgi:hypothetical protein